MRKRHKGPEEDHDTLGGAGKARGRNQPWDEHETSSDFMSQVGRPVSQEYWRLEAEGLEGPLGLTHSLCGSPGPVAQTLLGYTSFFFFELHLTVESLRIKWNSNPGVNAFC